MSISRRHNCGLKGTKKKIRTCSILSMFCNKYVYKSSLAVLRKPNQKVYKAPLILFSGYSHLPSFESTVKVHSWSMFP